MSRRVGVVLLVALALASLVVAAASSASDSEPSDAASLGAPGASLLTVSRFGRGAAENRPPRIVIARADGSGSRVLTTAWLSYVSPAGSHVAVVDSDVNWYTNQRLELYASAGGAPQHVVALGCTNLYWSPDSTKIACIEFNNQTGRGRLVVIDAVSGAKTTLATGFFDGQLSFSPDSTSLAYVQKPANTYHSAGSALKVIDLATQAVRTIRRGGVASPAWGPAEIAFAALKPRGRNYTVDTAVVKPDGSGFRRLTRFRPTLDLWGPHPVAWSADGTRLLAGMHGGYAWVARESYAIDPVRGGVRLIAHQVSPSALSRDGSYVIGQTGDAATTGLAGSNVVRVSWAGGRKRVLLRQAVEPSFSG